MNILCIGDVVGKPGRQTIEALLPGLREEYNIDAVIANVENLAHGFGMTPSTLNELRNSGVDFFTSGNHAWKNGSGVQYMREVNPTDVVRPANVLGDLPGRGWSLVEVNGTPVLIINLLGNLFMKDDVHSPFETFDAITQELDERYITIVDVHAEASGEKRPFSWYVDGRASVVYGTHTHVPTADEQLMPNGTAFVSDLGMTGAFESSLGMDRQLVLDKVVHGLAVSLEPPQHPTTGILTGVVVSIDEETCLATSIERIDRRVAL